MSVRRGPWTVADVPDQGGRTAGVTGANSGIGFEAAAVLARRGADTVLACRDTAKREAAAARMTAAAPGATVSVVRLDLASLDSVRAGAAEILAGHERLDLLINNAGLMWPAYGTTADGFELQFGTNHLGRPVPRPGCPAPAVGRVRAAHRRDLPGLTRRPAIGRRITGDAGPSPWRSNRRAR